MKRKITSSQWETIQEEARSAKLLLQGKSFSFFANFLIQGKLDIERMILNNTVRDVTEEHSISETIKKSFFTSKKDQLQELSGRYKMLAEVTQMLENKIRQRDDLLKLINEEKVLIDETQ